MSINSSYSPNAAINRRLLIENVQYSARVSSASDTTTLRQSINPTFRRITNLVTNIRDRAMASAQGERAYSQSAIDDALAEISNLLGSSLDLGGPENAVLKGVNAKQIADIEVLSLPLGKSLSFSGGVTTRERPASVVIKETSQLIQGGGTLSVDSGNGQKNISVREGTTLAGLVRTINSKNYGVRASEVDGRLQLASRDPNSNASLSVDVRPIRVVGGSLAPTIEGQNLTQVADVDISDLRLGQSATLQGTRDTLATSATVTYVGDGNGLVNGTAAFDVTGAYGTVNISATEGETLTQLATRINDATESSGVTAEVVDNELRLQSVEKGATSQIRVDNVVPHYESSVEGVSAQQIDTFELTEIADGSEVTLTGSITTAADEAHATYHGDTGGVVASSATFTLTGDLGSAEYSVTEGESLTDVRDRINGDTLTTGVSASVDGDELTFSSQAVGSGSSVQVSVSEISPNTEVAGVNASQFGSFEVVSSSADPGSVLKGKVAIAAAQAALVYEGSNGQVQDNSLLSITGNLGSTTILIVKNQSLVSVRDLINSNTDETGVVAMVSGDELTLKSQTYGSSAIVEAEAVTGKFDTTGGDGEGNATGLDAELIINGDAVTADANHVTYSDGVGSYSFDVEAGFSGTFDAITVNASTGNVSGVNAAQVSGFTVDSLESAPSQTLNLEVNTEAERGQLVYQGKSGEMKDAADVTISGEFGSASFSFADKQSLDSVRDAINAETSSTGVTATVSGNDLTLESVNQGTQGTVSISLESGKFDTSGGDGNGSAVGVDAEITINGEQMTANGNRLTYADGFGTYSIDLAEGFTGVADSVTATSNEGEFTISGVDGTGATTGTDAEANINGQNFIADGNDFQFTVEDADISFTLASGFSGTMDSITLRSTPSTFDVDGADEYGAASGSDGAATINGVTYTSSDDVFDVDVDGSNVTFEFTEDYLGGFDPIDIAAATSETRRSYSGNSYRAHGAQRVIELNGQSLAFENGRYIAEQEGIRLALKLADGFQGTFDAFAVSAGGNVNLAPISDIYDPLEGHALEATTQALGSLFEFASGGQYSDADANPFAAVHLAATALLQLQTLAGGESLPQGRSLRGVFLDQYA
ncbi:flagellin hook IN motif-containing protein [Rhodopirellula sp. SWK7]|uniref:flagellin hook IN motif-containing protein n=1 Tax=Rhodopirellula sp. SWK7 TaxID=595460 RepID=UPI000349583A|nr:flagellin hook IN motif-containing protein [Rhodopirellula sp. SWK7]